VLEQFDTSKRYPILQQDVSARIAGMAGELEKRFDSGRSRHVKNGEGGNFSERCHKFAQAVFEFVIAFVIFFALIIYTLNHLYSVVWMFNNEHYINTLETRAMQISELLVTSPGTWESSFPKSPGLACRSHQRGCRLPDQHQRLMTVKARTGSQQSGISTG